MNTGEMSLIIWLSQHNWMPKSNYKMIFLIKGVMVVTCYQFGGRLLIPPYHVRKNQITSMFTSTEGFCCCFLAYLGGKGELVASKFANK